MRRLLILAAVLALPACKKSAPENSTPTVETVSGLALIAYDPPKGAFTCHAPGAWEVREDSASGTDSVLFSGPDGTSYIGVIQYPNAGDHWSDAKKYAASFREIDPKGKQPVVETKTIGGAEVLRFHQERPFHKLHENKTAYMERHDYALIPVKGGFFEISHSAAVERYQETLPVFEAVVRSFKPKN